MLVHGDIWRLASRMEEVLTEFFLLISLQSFLPSLEKNLTPPKLLQLLGEGVVFMGVVWCSAMCSTYLSISFAELDSFFKSNKHVVTQAHACTHTELTF